uniref:Toll protein n=1 Tax=Narceus annularis TaxID=174156 RepID=A0A2I2MJM9_NARAN|nr:Toll gene [Glomeris marginata]
MSPSTSLTVSIWCFSLWAIALIDEGSPSLRLPSCPSTGWTCMQKSATWSADATTGPLQGLSLEYETQDRNNGNIESFAVLCARMTNIIPGKNVSSPDMYSEAMFKDFQFPSTLTFVKFKGCPLPTMPFRKILEPYSDRIMDFLFQSDVSYPNFDWTPFHNLNLKRVNVAYNGIENLPEDLFEVTLPNVTSFAAKINSISNIPSSLFRRSQNLTTIDLGANRLTAIQKGLFQGLRKLETLLLYNNRLVDIEEGSFSDLTSLQALSLQGNHLTHLPQGLLTNLTNLKHIDLLTNRFTELPEDLFASTSKIQQIKMFDNPYLTRLPEKIFNGLGNLSELHLYGTALRDLPANIFNDLGNLTQLHLYNNQLTNLPEVIFGRNPKLTELHLNGNKLRTLPKDVFVNQSNLVTLSLQDNGMDNIPESCFLNLMKLETLNLAKNNLRELPYNLLTFTPDLYNLDLSDNMISYSYENDTMGMGPFFMPRHIKNVYLRGNRMQNVPGPFLLSITWLQHLDMSFNAMVAIGSSDLQVVTDGAVLNFTGNPITSIEFDMQLMIATKLMHQPKARNNVILGSSPLFCDCNIEDFLIYLQSQRDPWFPYEVDATSLSCAGPPQLAHIPIPSLTIGQLTCDVHEQCPKDCHCLFRVSGRVQETICTNSGLRSLPWPVPWNTSVLRVDRNNLGALDDLPMERWTNLSELYLNDANLTRITISALPPNITKLALHGNQLSILPAHLMNTINSHPSLTEITLKDNPWSCECDEPSKDFKDWLNNNARKVPQLTSVRCRQGGREAGVSVTMTPDCPSTRDMAIIVSCVVLAIAAMCAFVAVGYYRYGRSVKVWMYAHQMCLWFVTEKDLDSDKTYDGFVSFSQEDADFVANYLLPGLEQGVPRYKLCIHYRDWLAGEWIPDQIIRSVNESKRTIVVLSKHFIQSVWGRLEFRTAYHQALQDRTNRIIVVVVGEVPPESEMDPELRTYVKLNTYVKWGDPWFWKKLRYAMPHHTCFGPSTISASVHHQQCVPTLSAISTASTALSDWTPLPITSTGDKMELVISQLNNIVKNDKVPYSTTNVV